MGAGSRTIRPFFALLALSLLLPGKAVEAEPITANFSINVTIIARASCQINNNQAADVDFGNAVRTDLIDGKRYAARTLPVKITCDNDPAGTLQFALQGTATPFDAAAIKTNVDRLGIRILKNGEPQALGTWNTVVKDQTITLEAVPETSPGTKLAGGDFNASATLEWKVE